MEYPPKDHDRCDWWRRNEAQFPKLAVVARYILGIPASSATSERFFSSGGLIVSNLRCRLNEYKVKDILKIRLNLVKVEEVDNASKENRHKKMLASGVGVAASDDEEV